MSQAITHWREAVQSLSKARVTDALSDREVLNTVIDFCERTLLWEIRLNAIEVKSYIDGYALSSSSGRIISIDHAMIGTRKIYPTSESNLDAFEKEGNVYDPDIYDVGAQWRRSQATDATRYYVKHEGDDQRKIYLVPEPTADSDAYASCTDLTYSASGKTITSAATDFEDAGFESGQILVVTGSTSNDRVYSISDVDGVEITVTESLVDEGTADATGVLSVDGLHVWANMSPSRVDVGRLEPSNLKVVTFEDWIYNDHFDTIRDGAIARLARYRDEKYHDVALAEYHESLYKRGWMDAARKKKKGYAARVSRDISA